VRRGLSPEINALATLFIAVISMGIVASLIVGRSRLRGDGIAHR
jgi:ABC-type spermidine/putrescine transport system permease subunit II